MKKFMPILIGVAIGYFAMPFLIATVSGLFSRGE